MRFKTVGNKADLAAIVVKNNSTTLTIPYGAPTFFTFNGTDDGTAVLNAHDAAAATNLNCFAGVVISSQQQLPATGMGPGMTGEAQVYGFVQQLRLIRQTRATSTDSFSTVGTLSVGDILTILTNSGYDAYTDIGASTQSLSATNAAQGYYQNYAILAQSVGSQAASASSVFGSTSSASLAVIQLVKAMLVSL